MKKSWIYTVLAIFTLALMFTVTNNVFANESVTSSTSEVNPMGEGKPKPKPPTKPEQPGYQVSDFEKEVVALTNAERAKQGLPELKLNTKLAEVARIKSQDMVDNNYFSHDSPTYGTPFEMMTQFGIEFKSAGENIAQGQTTPQDVVKAWMDSEGHRKNILDPSFTEIGVGYVANGHYWTQMFIGN